MSGVEAFDKEGDISLRIRPYRALALATAILLMAVTASVPTASVARAADSKSPRYLDGELQEIKARAEQGDAEAQLAYGLQFLFGYQDDRDKAQRWIAKAAENEHPRAQYLMARLFSEHASYAARRWTELSAKQGYAPAIMHLANLIGGRQRIQLLNKSAAKGYLPAIGELANSYEFGRGVEPNPQ